MPSDPPRALDRPTSADDLVANQVGALRTGAVPSRIDAAYELARSDHASARGALLQALDDPEPIVRVHAWGGILRQRGLTPYDQRHTALGAIKTYVVNRLPSVYREGAEALRALLVELDRGATPAQLGLDAAPAADPAAVDAFVRSLPADCPAIDTDAVARLDAPHRAWAVGIVLGALARRDPRAAVALLALAPPGAAAALDDLLAEDAADRAFAEAVRTARGALGHR